MQGALKNAFRGTRRFCTSWHGRDAISYHLVRKLLMCPVNPKFHWARFLRNISSRRVVTLHIEFGKRSGYFVSLQWDLAPNGGRSEVGGIGVGPKLCAVVRMGSRQLSISIPKMCVLNLIISGALQHIPNLIYQPISDNMTIYLLVYQNTLEFYLIMITVLPFSKIIFIQSIICI